MACLPGADDVVESRSHHRPADHRDGRAAPRADTLRRTRRPSSSSAGRIAIRPPPQAYPHSSGARASAHDRDRDRLRSKLVIADEPTTAPDVTISADTRADERADAPAQRGANHHHAQSRRGGALRQAVNVMYAAHRGEAARRRRSTRPRHPYTMALLRSGRGSIARARRASTVDASPRPHAPRPGCAFRALPLPVDAVPRRGAARAGRPAGHLPRACAPHDFSATAGAVAYGRSQPTLRAP